MDILVINAGSSSLKYQLINMTNESVSAKGVCERIGNKDSGIIHEVNGEKHAIKKILKSHTDALAAVLECLQSKEYGVIESVSDIGAIGHRVLHSGEDFDRSVIVDDAVMEICRKNEPLGPLHMPANLGCIEACKKIMPDKINVAVFDTAFHASMPQKAFMYAIPYQAYSEWKVRKYGFHGTSHKYVSKKACELIGENSKIITCHLGNGASIAAVKNGKCVDTSMGLTPLEGLMMGTRSGDIDPAVIEFIMNKTGKSIQDMMHYLNKESGYLGVTCYSSDSRDISTAASKGDEKCKLALEMFAYRVKKYIGSYAAAMNGADAIVFTGGIGENSYETRERIMKDMDYLGVDFDFEKNAKAKGGEFSEISKTNSKVKVYVIPTNEELVIARDTYELVNNC